METLEGSALYEYHPIFSFMTAEAFHYYTPAFLIIALDINSDIVGDSFWYSLNPSLPGEYRSKRFYELTQQYSPQQKEVIALALQYLDEEDKQIRKDIDGDEMDEESSYEEFWPYWSQWLPA